MVSNTVWIVSGLRERDLTSFLHYSFLILPLEARLAQSKILNFGVSGGCLGVSEWYSWKSEALGCFWWVSGFSVLTLWS